MSGKNLAERVVAWIADLAERVADLAERVVAWIADVAAILVCLGLMICGVIVLGGQCIEWLQNGYWTPHEFREFWQYLGAEGYPRFEWKGVEKLVARVLEMPLSLGFFLAGLVAGVAGVVVVKQAA